MMNLREKLTDDECDQLVEEAHIKGDGQSNYAEFYFLMASAQRYIILKIIEKISRSRHFNGYLDFTEVEEKRCLVKCCIDHC